MSEAKEFDFLKELPVPPKEKIARWGFYAGAAAIAVGAINMFFPSIIGAGELLIKATWTAVDYLVASAVLGASYIGIKNFWPVLKDGVELLARRTAYGLLRQMPTEALDLWIEERAEDRLFVHNAARSAAAAMASNNAKIAEYTSKAEKAQQNFEAASRSLKFGPNSDEAIDASKEAGHFYDLVEELQKIAGPLSTLYGWLEENARVADASLKEAKREVEAAKVKWEVALETEKGINAGLRGLMGGSRRKANADAAFDIIHKKYAGNFGKISSMRRLTREVFSKQDLNDAVSLQKAVDRLSAESKLLLGHNAPAPQLDLGKAPVAVPAVGSIRLFDESNKK